MHDIQKRNTSPLSFAIAMFGTSIGMAMGSRGTFALVLHFQFLFM